MSTYTNSLGQTIEPGDKVVAIASGYSHSIKERSGTFVGLSAAGSPQVRVTIPVYRWVKPDGTFGSWKDGNVKRARIELERVSTYYARRVYKLA